MRLTHEETSLVFSGDTNRNERLAPFAREASFFMCDAALLERDKEPGQTVPHLTAREAGRTAREANVHAFGLTHIRAGHAPEEYEKEASAEYADAFVVEEGKTYTF